MVPQSIKNYRCIQSITTTYPDCTGVCGDGCCGGIYLGEEVQDFEVGEIYELEISRGKTLVDILYIRYDYQRVGLTFDYTDTLFEDYFSEVAEHE